MGRAAVMRRLAGLLAAAVALLAAVPASACSVRNYRIPSNFELVHRADTIILGRVRAGRDAVELVPVRVLKGSHDGQPLRLFGRIGVRGRPVLASPTPLRAPHFSVWWGSCGRVSYSEGALVVAMFRRTSEGLHQYGEPFSRAVEDVESENGLWVRAVREYDAAQRNAFSALRGVTPSTLREVTESTLRGAGERLRARLAARRGDLAAQAMADDLQSWLDVTAPGGPVARRGPVWRWTGGTEGAGVELRDTTTRRAVAFRCVAGESALRIDLERPDGAPQLALAIGSRRFDVEGEGTQRRPGSTPASGYIAFTPGLATLMRRSTAPSGIAVDGRTLLVAPPADMLQKLAVGCALMLRSERAGGPPR